MVDQSSPLSVKRKADCSCTGILGLRRKASEAPSIRHGNEMVTVHVGRRDMKRTFRVHRDLLTTHSEFFQIALTQNWKEGQDSMVSLEEDCPEHFEIFYNFVYTGHIFAIQEGDYTGPNKDNGTGPLDKEWKRLGFCWILGEKLLSTSFKDAITSTLIVKLEGGKGWPLHMHTTLYPKSSPSSIVRKLLVDIAVWRWSDASWDGQTSNEAWSQFFLEVASAMNKIKKSGLQGRAPFEGVNTCIYHEHVAEGKPCFKSMF